MLELASGVGVAEEAGVGAGDGVDTGVETGAGVGVGVGEGVGVGQGFIMFSQLWRAGVLPSSSARSSEQRACQASRSGGAAFFSADPGKTI